MSQPTYLGADLLTSIRNLGMIPSTAATASADSDLLRHATEGIRSYLLSEILLLRESYFKYRKREPLVNGQAEYRIPPRAIYDKLSNVWLITTGSSGSEDRFELDPIPEAELDRYNAAGDIGVPVGFVLDGTYLRFIPDRNPSFTGQLEWDYFIRPGAMVLQTEARQVASVDSTTAVTLASAVPTGWTAANTFDIHSRHSGGDYKSIERAASTVSGTGITFSAAIDGSVFGEKPVAVGDWVCLEGETALPGVPPEWFSIVARAAAMAHAEATENRKKFDMHSAVLQGFIKRTTKAMESRVEEKPIVLGRKRSYLGIRRRWR